MKVRSSFTKLKLLIKDNPDKALYAVLILCFLIRVSYQIFYVKYYQFYDPYRDTDNPLVVYEYEPMARNLVQGRGYRIPDSEYPTAKRGPVYPLFLGLLYWIFGINLKIAIIFQAIFDTLTCLIIHHISLNIFNRRSTALLSSFIWAVYLPGVLFVHKLYCEPMFTMLLSLFILFNIKSLKSPCTKYFVYSGALLGVATLCRPVPQLYFVFVFISYYLNFRRKKQNTAMAIAIFFLSFALTLAPWTVRNYNIFERFIPASTLFGFNLLLSNFHLVMDNEDYLAPLNMNEYYTYEKNIDRKYAPEKLSETQRGDIYLKEALRAIKDSPAKYLVLCARRFTKFWFNFGDEGYGILKEYIFVLLNGPLMLLAILPFIYYKGTWTELSWPVSFMILYNTAVHTLLVANMRFAIPIMPSVLVLAAWAITESAVFKKLLSVPTTDMKL